MAIQLNVATRNARLDQIESLNATSCAMEIRTGAQPANCAAASTGTILATILLPSDWMAVAASGVKSKSGTWQDASADGAGTAAHFRVYNNQTTKDGSTCFMQGTVGMVGTEDLVVDNSSFSVGQSFTVTTFSLTDGNA